MMKTRRSTSKEPVRPRLECPAELPATITMSDGRVYRVTGHVWFLPEDAGSAATVRFNWALLTGVVIAGTTTSVMSPRAISLVKLYILERIVATARSLKPASGRNILKAMVRLARWLALHPEHMPIARGFDWADLTADIFDAWLTTEYYTRQKGSYPMWVRSFYLWGADGEAGHSDFSAELANILTDLTLKNHAVGGLVESRDKRRGPFTRNELDLIFRACNDGKGTDRDRALAWTFLLTAIRPKQVFLLTNEDLEVIHDSGEVRDTGVTSSQTTYRLRVGKIKRRGSIIEYHYLPLSEGCARLLLDLRRPESGPTDKLFWWVSSSYNGYIENRLKAFSRDADLRSLRLPLKTPKSGEPLHELLHITPRRFRYGVATDRISRGESPENVADTLGHKGTTTVGIYVETSPGIADVFQRATDYAIAPLIALMDGRAQSPESLLLTNVAPNKPHKRRASRDVTEFWIDNTGPRHGQDLRRRQPSRGPKRLSHELHRSDARIRDLIARARNKFPLEYPNQDFDEQVWSVSHLRERPNVVHKASIRFTTFSSLNNSQNRLSPTQEAALASYFWDPIKSWIVISNNVTVESNAARVNAARHFWDFLLTFRGKQASAFVWGELAEGDFIAFEQFLLSRKTRCGTPLKPATIICNICHMQLLVDFLASHGICRHVVYIPQTISARSAAILSLDEKKVMAERKLPAPDVLESLAGIYYRLTTAPISEVSDWMLIIISAIAILMLTGLRVGELVTLPFDCEVEDKYSDGQSDKPDSYRYGIKYWVEKTKIKTMRIKWISPTAEAVVRDSVARIKRLTTAARERAKVLEADPARVSLPSEISNRTTLPRRVVLALLGQKLQWRVRNDPQGLLPEYGTAHDRYYYTKDLEKYLRSRRVEHLYTIRHDDGTFQMLSESLFITFDKQSLSRLRTDPCFLLVEPIKSHNIVHHLSSPHNVFNVYGSTEWERELTTNTHAFRHWLIHIAYQGGMVIHLILRYFAKQHDSDIAAYLHFTTDETDAYVPEELCGEKFYAAVQP